MFPINPVLVIIAVTVIVTLHSTMFPINREVDFVTRFERNLYIPLCFLLISAVVRGITN